MNERMDDAKKIVEDLSKDLELAKVEEMIKDNCISFEYEGKQYRVRLLTNKEKEELQTLRIKKYNSMAQEKDANGNYVYLTEKSLIKVFKERGDIDLDQNSEEIKKIEAEETALQLKLGEAISKNKGEIILNEYKNQIVELRIKKQILNTQRTLLLESSFENVLLAYAAKIITYLSTDILIDGVWTRKWTNLEEFEKTPEEGLIIKAAQYSMILQYI